MAALFNNLGSKMTVKEFKIWLIANDLNQKKLAAILGITEATLINYNKNKRYPTVLIYALKGLETELKNTTKQG